MELINNQLYVYGGRSWNIHNDLLQYDITRKQWATLPQKGEVQRHGRHGHSMNRYGHILLIFGG